MSLRNLLKGIAAGAFVLSLPVLFGTLSLRWLVSDVGWYRAGFSKYGVSERTGISPDELGRAAEQISRYLLLERDSIDIPVKVGNQMRPLFNERELKHLDDVQKLLAGFYTIQGAAAWWVILYLVACRLWLKGGSRSAVGNQLRWGGALALALFGAFGLLSMMDFDELFLRFHLISFDNDLWMLDPTRDYLIMMFPQGFWYDSAVRLATATGAQALVAILLGSLLARESSTLSFRPSARIRR